MLYMLPQLLGGEDKLVAVDMEELADCHAESSPKGEYPCDKELFDLCCILMIENEWDAPRDGHEAAELYLCLRDTIHNEMW